MFFFVIASLISLQVNYPVDAKKNHSKFSVVLDTPEYNRVTELKSHMSMVSQTSHYKSSAYTCVTLRYKSMSPVCK